MKNKAEKKKPYHSLWSNIRWSVSGQLRYAPVAFLSYLVETPINVALAYAGIYLPSLVIAEVTGNHTPAHAAATVGLLLFLMFAGTTAQKVLKYVKWRYLERYRYHISDEFHKKQTSMFYQTYETKKFRDLGNRADKATQMWDGVQPVSDLPRQTWALVESVLCYLLFGSVVSFVSPWIVLLLTVAPVINWYAVKKFQDWQYANQDKWTAVDSKLWYVGKKTGDFSYAKDIRIYSMASWLTDMYTSFSKEREHWDITLVKRMFASKLANLFVILIRDGAAYALLIYMFLNGEITVDQFVLYFAAISSFANWIGGILGNWNALHSTSLAICDLREYIEYPEQDGTGEATAAEVVHSDCPPEIRLEHVTFRYDEAEEDTIRDVSFTIHSGEKIALVGMNGAGKTTLVKLICGLYAPTSGTIFINGVDVRKFKRKDYYTLFSPVFQDVRTAFFSLAETVSGTYEKDTDLARAESCMRMAGLGDKLDTLSNGVHTHLDKQLHEDGTELSGGEIQKLMLARALYKNAPVLVLDEPTAALDPIAENEIYLNYNAMSTGKSSLFISHRLASTRFCDRILYLENGKIVEEGTHEELIAKGGEYSKLFDIQSCWYRDEYESNKENVQ